MNNYELVVLYLLVFDKTVLKCINNMKTKLYNVIVTVLVVVRSHVFSVQVERYYTNSCFIAHF